MATLKTTVVRNVPEWAVQYIEYNDSSCLTEAEIAEIDQWLEDLRKEGLRLIFPKDGSHNEFCSHPAFGDPCAVVDYEAEVLLKDKSISESTKGEAK